MYKIIALCALALVATARPQATSYVSFNENHNSINHIQSAHQDIPQHYSAEHAPQTVTKIAIPVLTKTQAPAAPSYYTVSAPRLTSLSSPSASAPEYHSSKHEEEESYGPAKYEFAYIIQDPHTGDYHSQEEKRDGHHVVGQYSLHEADGTVRVVKYFDDGHGFNAVVERQGQPTEAPVQYKKLVAELPQYPSYH